MSSAVTSRFCPESGIPETAMTREPTVKAPIHWVRIHPAHIHVRSMSHLRGKLLANQGRESFTRKLGANLAVQRDRGDGPEGGPVARVLTLGHRRCRDMFIVMVGAFAIVIDIGSTLGTPSLGPLVRYGVAAGVAVFSLYANRASAARRAQVRGGSGQDG